MRETFDLPQAKIGIVPNKEGRHGLLQMVKVFKERQAVLVAGVLRTYQTPLTSPPYGETKTAEVPLRSATIVEIGDLLSVRRNDREEIVMRMSDSKERAEWQLALNEHCEYANKIFNKSAHIGRFDVPGLFRGRWTCCGQFSSEVADRRYFFRPFMAISSFFVNV